MEPKNKATWNPEHKRARRKRESVAGKKDNFIEQDRGVDDVTLPPGKGLQEDGRKLFAVQHRGMKCCFFLLLLRPLYNIVLSFVVLLFPCPFSTPRSFRLPSFRSETWQESG